MNLLILILLVIMLIIIILNFIAILNIKKNEDFANMVENLCNYNRNSSALEIESYRHLIYRYLYKLDNNEYDNSKNLFESTYYILIIFYSIIILSLLKNLLIINSDVIISYILIIGFYISFIIMGYNILNNYKKIEEIKYDSKSELNKYAKIYKLLNVFMYINNFNQNKLSYSNPNLPFKTLNDTLFSNISSFENTANQSIITEKLYTGYVNLDFVKYITFDRLNSRYYFKEYFNPNNTYINITYYNLFDRIKNEYIIYEKYETKEEFIDYECSIRVLTDDDIKTIKTDKDGKKYIENKTIVPIQGTDGNNVNYNKQYVEEKILKGSNGEETLEYIIKTCEDNKLNEGESKRLDSNGKKYIVKKRTIDIAKVKIKKLLKIENDINDNPEKFRRVYTKLLNLIESYNNNNQERILFETDELPMLLYLTIIIDVNMALMKSKINDSLPHDNFLNINYYNNNKNIIFDDNEHVFKDVKKTISNISSYYIYYIIYIVFILLLLLHYVYISLNNIYYSYLLIIFLVIYIIILIIISYKNLLFT